MMKMPTIPQQGSSATSCYQVRVWCWVSRKAESPVHKRKYKQRMLPSVMKSCSIVIKSKDNESEEENVYRTSGTMPKQDRVGVLVGSSIDAARQFVKKVEELNKEKNDQDLQVLVCDAHNVTENSKEQKIVEVLRERKRMLEEGKVSCIVMPCEASHIWHEELCKDSGVFVLNMVDCVADQLQQMRLRPLEAGSTSLKIGLVGSHSALYHKALASRGFEVVLPDEATRDHVIVPTIQALREKDFKGAKILFRIALQLLLIKAVNIVVVTSYDLSSLLGPEDPLLQRCLNPLDALARATVKKMSL